MKPGDIIETAIWLSGEETDQMIQAFKDRTAENLKEAAKNFNVEIAPFIWTIKGVTEDRVPPVPDHISGPDVQLLVGEAQVFEKPLTVIHKQTGFVYDLTKEDLASLRKITRRVHAKRQPGSALTDQQCDAVIEHLGPEAVLKTLRNGRLDA